MIIIEAWLQHHNTWQAHVLLSIKTISGLVMSSKKQLSCGRDFFAVPNLAVALENGGKCGYN